MNNLLVEKLERGETVPYFGANTLQGDFVSRDSYNDRPFVMLFVSPTCGACHEKMRTIMLLKDKILGSKEELVIISLSDEDATQKYVNKLGFDMPILVAPRDHNQLAEDYKVPATPWYYLVDDNGRVEAGGSLDITWNTLLDRWSAISTNKEVSIPN